MSELRDRIFGVIAIAENVDSSVKAINQAAITTMMSGDAESALTLFLQALRLSGSNPELQAQCLINIGDWVRRLPGELALVQEIFEKAATLPTGPITKSRLRSMQAMIYNNREGIDENVRILTEAIVLARNAAAAQPKEALMAEKFAIHRMAGTVCQWGSAEQKAMILAEIDELLPKLDPHSSEVPRLNYPKARMIAETAPEEAVSLLDAGAKRLWSESPSDAGVYLVHAAEIALRYLNDKARAREYLSQAEECLPVIEKFAFGRDVVMSKYYEVLSALMA